jgi:hypothetical protein
MAAPETLTFVPRLFEGDEAANLALEVMLADRQQLRASLIMAAGVCMARDLPGCSAAIIVAYNRLGLADGADG